MQLLSEIQSTYVSTAVAVSRNFGFARMQLLSEIRIPLKGFTAVDDFQNFEILHVCNYYLRFESTLRGFTTVAVFREFRDFARMRNPG
ncbi:hypothetical protein CEXT_403301 [Caerostris extrusa]|uniref:Uncharacterized protein n=1 Tax=Caerostris extrusa TaxID=172846 RepID=A0AAV4TKR8_CAEEX|nr:hypothetical protein CEXT_403301 [Caerostris extrusa]